MTRLEGKIALVTGAQQGIGRSIAVALSRAGAGRRAVVVRADVALSGAGAGRRGRGRPGTSSLTSTSRAGSSVPSRGAVRGVHYSASKGGVVVFVASDDARFITGQTVHVNGGSYMP